MSIIVPSSLPTSTKTYLQLVQTLCIETGATAGLTTAGATGEWARLCYWIQQAWIEIQESTMEYDWMRKAASFNTIPNQGEYAPSASPLSLTDFGQWRDKSFRIYLTSAGVGTEWLLNYKDYNAFRDFYLLSSRKLTYARPSEITVSPSKSLILGLAPNDIYTVSGEYYMDPQVLFNDTDIPTSTFPGRFHMAIVYRAMMKYGGFESAQEVFSRGQMEYKSMMNAIRRNQTPKITRGGSMI